MIFTIAIDFTDVFIKPNPLHNLYTKDSTTLYRGMSN